MAFRALLITAFLGLMMGQNQDSTSISLSGVPPYTPVEQISLEVNEYVELHSIVKIVSMEACQIYVGWTIDTSLVRVDTMYFDVYDAYGNPFEWWIVWEQSSNATWRYQGQEVPYFAFLMLGPGVPAFAIQPERSPWHIGVVRIVGENPGQFIMDSLNGAFGYGNCNSNPDWITFSYTPIPVVVNPTIVQEETENQTVIDVALYPNPAKGNVVIKLKTRRSLPVEVSIHDVYGRRIKSLFSGEIGSGALSLHWKRETDTGDLISDGVYFVRVNFGTRMTIVKLVLM